MFLPRKRFEKLRVSRDRYVFSLTRARARAEGSLSAKTPQPRTVIAFHVHTETRPVRKLANFGNARATSTWKLRLPIGKLYSPRFGKASRRNSDYVIRPELRNAI